MPRQVRIEYEDAIYHCMARGNRCEDIMLDEEDGLAFERLIIGVSRIIATFLLKPCWFGFRLRDAETSSN